MEAENPVAPEELDPAEEELEATLPTEEDEERFADEDPAELDD